MSLTAEILRVSRENKRLRRKKRLEDYYLRLQRDKSRKFISQVIKLSWFQKFINWVKGLLLTRSKISPARAPLMHRS